MTQHMTKPGFSLTIARDTLVAALGRANLTASTKPFIPVLTTVKMEHGSGGALRLTTTDHDQTLTLGVEAEGAGPAVCLPVKRLLDLVQALPPGDVSVKVNDQGTRAVVSGGGARLQLYGIPADEFPPTPRATFSGEITVPGSEFIAALGHAATHTSRADLSRPILCGVLVDSRADGIFIVGCDGGAAGCIRVGDAATTLGQWILPRQSASVISKLFTGCEQITARVSSMMVRLSSAGVRLDLRLIEGPYPHYQGFLVTKDNKQVGTVDSLLLGASLRRVKALGGVICTTLEWSRSTLTVRAESQNGIVNDEIPCTFDGTKGFTIGFDAEYVTDALATIGADTVRFSMLSEERPAVISPADLSPDRLAALSPLRIKAAPAQIAA